VDGTELLARESIRDLVARYNMLGDSGRVDEVAALFCPDGCLEIGDRTATRTVQGRERIRELLRAISADWARAPGARYVRHVLSTHVIDMTDSHSARGSSYVLVVREGGLATWGRYFDEYRESGGQWLFAYRRALADTRSAASAVIGATPAGT
jgi:hypothetical protein